MHGDGTPGYHDLQYVDDVSLTSGSATPTPTPAPTRDAEADGHADRRSDADAEADRDADRRADGDADARPRRRPRRRRSGCNGAAADNGPLSNSSGTLATGVAKPFDYPVQHGCNGAGYTAAVIIDDPVNTSYLRAISPPPA